MDREKFLFKKKQAYYDGNSVGFLIDHDVTILKIIVTETNLLILPSQPLFQQVDFTVHSFQTKLIDLCRRTQVLSFLEPSPEPFPEEYVLWTRHI